MKTLEDMTAQELKDYILGLYAIPVREFTNPDRQNMTEAKSELLKRGYETRYINDQTIRFPKVKVAK